MDFIEDWTSTMWFCLGIAFLVIEIFSFTLWALFFSLSSLIIWILSFFNILKSLEYQIIVFSLLSIFFVVVLKSKMKKIITSCRGESVDDSIISKTVIVITKFNDKTNYEGKVEYGGSHWKARSNMEELNKGDIAIIEQRENITLVINKLNKEKKNGN